MEDTSHARPKVPEVLPDARRLPGLQGWKIDEWHVQSLQRRACVPVLRKVLEEVTMTGEYFTPCGTCDGSGKHILASISIGSGTQSTTEACPSCRGTGKVIGKPATKQDFQAYASEPCEVTDQIFALAKQIQQPRTVRVEKRTTERKQRQVTVRKERKVGGFLGIGAKTEYYDDVETQYYDEPKTVNVEETTQPADVVLGSWENKNWWHDDPRDYVRVSTYEALLTAGAEFAVREKFEVTYDAPSFNWWNELSEKSDWKPVPIKSIDDIMRQFDFDVYVGDWERVANYFFESFEDFSSVAAFHNVTIMIQRKYKKGYGLLTTLQDMQAKIT